MSSATVVIGTLRIIYIDLDKGGYLVNIFLISPYVVGTHMKRLLPPPPPPPPPPPGASNEYPQHTFSWRNKKNINTFGLKKSALASAMDLIHILIKSQLTDRLVWMVCNKKCLAGLVVSAPDFRSQGSGFESCWRPFIITLPLSQLK